MKKAGGMNFGVRFYRRGVAKSALKEQFSQEKVLAVNDTPAEKPKQLVATPVIEPAKAAKEKILRDAAMAGDCYIIRTLVMEGVDLEARDEQGRTALNIATQYNQADAIKTILAAREMRRMAKLGDLPDTKFFRKFAAKTGNGT